jgi:flagellar hook protein FlgE
MLGSIYIGLTGLDAYSRGLQQISDNVANLNSSGFKQKDVTFGNLVSGQSSGGLSYLTANPGGGNGVSLNLNRIDFSQGELRPSEGALDLAIDGNGLLVLFDGSETLYARTGRFEVDNQGYIVLSGTDYSLATLDAAGRPMAVSIDGKRTDPPEQTTLLRFADNLSSTATSYAINDVRVFDASGEAHIWQLAFARDDTPGTNVWTLTVTDDDGQTIGAQNLRFAQGSVDPDTAQLVFEDSPNNFSVTFDFSQNVSSFSSGEVSTLRAAEIDGKGAGTIATISVNEQGAIALGYTNGETIELGAIALADFRDLQALEAIGDSLYRYNGSGDHAIVGSTDPRVGRVFGNRLEASNVDLSNQFGSLILIQRGFQASSQIISVSNDMIQQLFGIRGQG